MRGLLGCFVLAACLAACQAQLRVPRMQDGHHYGLYGSQIHLEVFVDFACDDCQRAWPQLRALFDHYPTGTLEVTLHHLPLPFHRTSFPLAAAVEGVCDALPDRCWEFMDHVFSHQHNVSNSATRNMTDDMMLERVAALAVPFGLSRTTMLGFLSSKSNAYHNARASFKFSVQRGGVGGTPAVALNGVMIENPSELLGRSASASFPLALADWTTQHWTAYLDSLLGFTVEDSQQPPQPAAVPPPPSRAQAIAGEGGGCSDEDKEERPCPRVPRRVQDGVDLMNQ